MVRSDDVWLGITDTATEGRFLWVDGDPFNAGDFAWVKNNPDNRRNNEDCVHINLPNHEDNAANDLRCNANVHGLCEKPVRY